MHIGSQRAVKAQRRRKEVRMKKRPPTGSRDCLPRLFLLSTMSHTVYFSHYEFSMHMKTTLITWIAIIIIVVGGVWYYLAHKSAPDTAAGPSTAMGINGSPNQGNLGQPDNGTVQQPMADGAEGAIIGANLALGTNSNATLGKYLIGYNGMTVYQFAGDKVGTSTCYSTCAKNWPPYLVGPEDNLTQLEAGITGKTDTIIRADGSIQMTYNGFPLYFYLGDKASGDTSGNLANHAAWGIVKP